MGQDADAGAAPDAARELLRHTVATLAYRAEKVLREVPDGFPEFRLAANGRTALELLGHLADLMEWGTRFTAGENKWQPGETTAWEAARERFFRGIAALDAGLGGAGLGQLSARRHLPGPDRRRSDPRGQLAMMRGAAGLSVRPESYARAEIRTGRVGLDQSAKRTEFDGDASKYRT